MQSEQELLPAAVLQTPDVHAAIILAPRPHLQEGSGEETVSLAQSLTLPVGGGVSLLMVWLRYERASCNTFCTPACGRSAAFHGVHTGSG